MRFTCQPEWSGFLNQNAQDPIFFSIWSSIYDSADVVRRQKELGFLSRTPRMHRILYSSRFGVASMIPLMSYVDGKNLAFYPVPPERTGSYILLDLE